MQLLFFFLPAFPSAAPCHSTPANRRVSHCFRSIPAGIAGGIFGMLFTQEKSRTPAHPPPPLRDPRRAAQQPSIGQPRRALAFIVSHRHHFCGSLPPWARRLARLHSGSSALALNWGIGALREEQQPTSKRKRGTCLRAAQASPPPVDPNGVNPDQRQRN